MQPDPETARTHFERAAALGETEAYPLMAGLCSALRPTPARACRTETLHRWAAAGDSAGVAASGRHLRTLRRAAARGDAAAKAELADLRKRGRLPARL